MFASQWKSSQRNDPPGLYCELASYTRWSSFLMYNVHYQLLTCLCCYTSMALLLVSIQWLFVFSQVVFFFKLCVQEQFHWMWSKGIKHSNTSCHPLEVLCVLFHNDVFPSTLLPKHHHALQCCLWSYKNETRFKRITLDDMDFTWLHWIQISRTLCCIHPYVLYISSTDLTSTPNLWKPRLKFWHQQEVATWISKSCSGQVDRKVQPSLLTSAYTWQTIHSQLPGSLIFSFFSGFETSLFLIFQETLGEAESFVVTARV